MLDRRPVRGPIAAALALFAVTSLTGAGLRKTDPASVVPLDRIPASHRGQVAEVIRDATLHRKGAPDSFPCNRYLYLCLLNEPALTVSLWKDLAVSPARLDQVSADTYRGSDGAGTDASWHILLRTPQMHVMYADIEHTAPRTGAKLVGRLVLIVRSQYYRRGASESWIQHEVEAFVKIDSLGWKAVAATVRPVIEKVLEDQLQEAGWFVSLMGRLVETYPDWAVEVAESQPAVRSDLKTNFRTVVDQARRPGASNGRPQVANRSEPGGTPARR